MLLKYIAGILLTGGFLFSGINDLKQGYKFNGIVGLICAAVIAVNVGVFFFE